MRALIIATLAFVSINLSGCAVPGMGMVDAPTYQQNQQYVAQQVRYGVVAQVRAVDIKAQQQSTLGSLVQGAPAGFLAALVFKNKSWQTQAAAATLATWGASALSQAASTTKGIQMIIVLSDRSVISVTQPQERDNPITPGMKVLIEGSGRVMRSMY